MCLQCGRRRFDSWVGKIPWRREQLPTPVFWPGEFHGLYSPWGRKESDITERLSLHELCMHPRRHLPGECTSQRLSRTVSLQHEKAFPEQFLEPADPTGVHLRLSLGPRRALSQELLQEAAPAKPGFPVPLQAAPHGGWTCPSLPTRPVTRNCSHPFLPSVPTPRCLECGF